MKAEVFRSDQDEIVDFQAQREMCGILELIVHVTAEIGIMPAHAQWRQGTHDPTGIELPGVVWVIQVAMRRKVVVRDHWLLPLSLADVDAICHCAHDCSLLMGIIAILLSYCITAAKDHLP